MSPRRTEQASRSTNQTRRRPLTDLGVPEDLAARLVARRIPVAAVEKIARANIPWPFVGYLLNTPGLARSVDVTGLLLLWDDAESEPHVRNWAQVGSLEAAHRLDALGVTPEMAKAFPLAADQPLTRLVRVTQEARKRGMSTADLLLWHTGGILLLEPPWVAEDQFATWRAVGTRQIGMRRAAIACAAGLTPQEAAEQVANGTFNEHGLRLLAILRR